LNNRLDIQMYHHPRSAGEPDGKGDILITLICHCVFRRILTVKIILK